MTIPGRGGVGGGARHIYIYIFPEELPPLRRGIGGYYPRMEADEWSDQCAKLRAEELRLRVRNKDKLKPKKLMQVRLWKKSRAEERFKTVAIRADGPLLESCGTVLDVTNGTDQFGEAGAFAITVEPDASASAVNGEIDASPATQLYLTSTMQPPGKKHRFDNHVVKVEGDKEFESSNYAYTVAGVVVDENKDGGQVIDYQVAAGLPMQKRLRVHSPVPRIRDG